MLSSLIYTDFFTSKEIYGHLLERLAAQAKTAYPHDGAVFSFMPRLLAAVGDMEFVCLGRAPIAALLSSAREEPRGTGRRRL